MRAAKRRSRVKRFEALPIQALYRVSDLARASGVPHRRLQRLLKSEDVQPPFGYAALVDEAERP